MERLAAAVASILAFVFSTVIVVGPIIAHAQVTFAGTQINVSSTAIGSPSGVALDGKGNVFITDRVNNLLLRVPATSSGFGPPSVILSGLSAPGGVASDWSGNVFVADTGNNRIVMLPVTANGYGSPVSLGASLSSPAGVAVDPTDNIYIADSGNNRIVQLPRIGTSYGSPVIVATGFSSPMGVAVDAALALYVADTGNNRAIKIPASPAGYTTQQLLTRALMAPLSIAVDKSGNVYIADNGESRIVEDPWNGGAKRFNSVTTVGSNFASPLAVGVDWSGSLYVADGVTNQVEEVVAPSVGFMPAYLNAAPVTQTYSFRIASGTTVGAVSIYSQGISGRDFKDAGGSTCTIQTYLAASLCSVQVAFAPLSSGLRTGAITLYDGQGNTLASAYISGIGIAPQAAYLPATVTQLGSQLSGPAGVAVDGSGNLFISDTGNNRVIEIPWTGSSYGPESVIPITGLSSPMGITVDGAGNLYIVSNGNDKVIKLPWTGTSFGAQMKVANGLYGPSGVTVDGTGNLYITDTLDNNLDKLPWTGSNYAQAQSLGNYHKFPVGIAVDANGNVYFAMPYQNTLVKIPWSGTQYLNQITLPLNGVSFPSAIAVDANSNLYVLDAASGALVMLPSTGSGFGAQITVASGFNAPSGLAIDAQGNIYVADTGNNQVVKLNLSQPGTINFANTYLGSMSVDSAKIALVENVGNQPITLVDLTYPTDFPEDSSASSACTSATTLLPGNSCQLPIDFVPQNAGADISEAVSVGIVFEEGPETRTSFSVQGTGMSRLAQTINFPPISDTVFGAAPIALVAAASSGLPVMYQILSGSAKLSSDGRWISIAGAGTVVVQATQVGNSNYGPAQSVSISFRIAPAVLSVVPGNATAIYGSVPQAFGYSITGFVAGQSASQVVTGQATVSVRAASPLNVGTYTIVASQGSLAAANYTFVFTTGTLTVNKAMLQVRAGSLSITYGSVVPSLSWSMSGFANGDNPASVSGAPALATVANATSPVGTYPVTAALGTLNSLNYSFSFNAGAISVQPAVLTVTAVNQSATYGSALPILTYVLSGFVSGDSGNNSISGIASVSAKCSSSPNVGVYAITISQGSLKSTNYTFHFVQGTLQITKALLTVKANDMTMSYGGKVPSPSYSMTGFVYNDTQASAVTGSPAFATSATSTAKPGNFALVVSAGSLAANNYTFTYQPGNLVVGKAQLVVTPATASMTYGGLLPVIVPQYSGFVNGDGVSTVSGTPACSSQASSSSAVGKYATVCSVGNLTSDLYRFTFVNGSLTVNKAIITVQANAISMTYGGDIPKLSYTLAGLTNGDTASVISGQPTLVAGATKTSAVGTYSITASVGTLVATNYTFSISNSKLTVTKASLVLTPNSVTMTYGGQTQPLTYSVSGLLNGDPTSVIKGVPQYVNAVSKTSPAGTYSFQMQAGTLTAANYSFTFADGTATVNKAKLTLTANNLSMKAGSAVPALTWAATGFVNGDTSSTALKGAPALATTASAASKAGSYPITIVAGSATASNYILSAVDGTMTVTQ